MKQLSSIIFFLLLCHTYSLYSQTDNVGSGRAISFNGTTDYINFGDRYSDLDLPFTISAWVRLDPSNAQPGPVFTNRNCDPIYTGFRLIVNNNVISMDYGDGFGGNNPAFRRGKIASINSLSGKWNHVTAVVRGPNDMDLYLNGINVGGDYTGGSANPMDSGKPGFTSTGYFISNGVIYRFNGIIDEMRLWNRPLTEEEIRQTMCINLKGNEAGLIGYWDFNETSGATVFDKSSNKFNGQFVGSPQRVFSGAPIGDVSTYLYSTNWLNGTLSLQDGDHQLDVKNIKGNVSGVQVYEVKNSPSQTVGLGVNYSGPYFGVFLVSQDPNVSFDAEYYFKGNGSCSLFMRDDNSQSLWGEFTSPITGKLQRGEILKGFGGKANLELGVDKILCDQSSYMISTDISDPEFTFQWNTGESTSSIVVNQSGLYSVKVFGTCGMITDSVAINFNDSPEPISLGNDAVLCDQPTYTISSGVTDPQFSFKWNTGQITSSIAVRTTGIYSVKVSGFCGDITDSISLIFETSPKPISLGDDEQLCSFSKRILQPVADPAGLLFQWQDGSKNSTFEAKEFGQFWVIVKNLCGQESDSVMYSSLDLPIELKQNVITPNGDGKNDYFMVDDQLIGLISIQIVDRWGKEMYYASSYNNTWNGDGLSPGVYYVILEGSCGEKTKSPLTIMR